jgi:hypothetical protein
VSTLATAVTHPAVIAGVPIASTNNKMPKVGKKKFPYTKKGKEASKKEAKNLAKKC